MRNGLAGKANGEGERGGLTVNFRANAGQSRLERASPRRAKVVWVTEDRARRPEAGDQSPEAGATERGQTKLTKSLDFDAGLMEPVRLQGDDEPTGVGARPLPKFKWWGGLVSLVR